MPRKKKPSVDVEERRFCDVCNKDIHVGTGGDNNWNGHLKSKAHKQKMTLRKDPKITTFFSRGPPSINPPPGPSAPKRVMNTVSETEGEQNDIIDVDMFSGSGFGSANHPVEDTLALQLIRRLRRLASNLPEMVPLGHPEDVLAQFVNFDPAAALASQECEDAWEAVNKALDNTIGYRKSIPELISIVRRGAYGITGFCARLEAICNDYNIDGVLLEGRLNNLSTAVIAW
ncbi:hypothetical protein B0H21DRAFT_826674 [Amylocystis lapponica]|nr:hypothetical protein B0H21DRAFT_826674 [Amylocystis lapponica]